MMDRYLSNTLTFNIDCNNDEPTFKRYIYEHENVVKNRFIFNICVLNINPNFYQILNLILI